MKKSLTEELEEFFELWNSTSIIKFINIIHELHKIFDIEDDMSPQKETETEEQYQERLAIIHHEQNKRLAEAAFLISWIAEMYGGKLVQTNVRFKGLWERMEKVAAELKQ